MRPAQFLSTTAVALALATGCGEQPKTDVAKPTATATPPRTFTAGEVASFFKAVTSDPLQADAQTSFDAVRLADSDFDREQIARRWYGSFSLYVLKDPAATAIYERDRGQPVEPDPHGIYWHGDTAMKPYRNVVLVWTAEDGQTTDERFKRLDTVLSKLGTDPAKVRAQLPPEDRPCPKEQATGTCRAASGATVTTVARDQPLRLPALKVKLVKVKTGNAVLPKNRFTPRYRAKGRYVMTVVRIKNTGDEALTSLRDARLTIGDRIYEQDRQALFSLVPYDSFPLQPDDSLTTAVVFDIPVKAARDALDHGTLAFPASAEDYVEVDEAEAVGQIQLRTGAGPATNPTSGTNA